MNVQLPDFKSKKNLVPLLLLIAGLGLAFGKPLYSKLSPAKLDLQIQHQPLIMPAVYKVYANENALDGKYSLFKMLVTNNSHNTARNVDVSYQIPNYIDWKSITKIPILLPGESVVVNCYPSFNDKIVEKTTSSREQVNIKVTGNNISDVEQSFPIDIKGRNEFMYSFIPADEIRTAKEGFDNMSLLTCYVTPEDPIIKYYTQKVQEKVLKGEVTNEKSEKEGIRFLEGIYYSTLISHMVYSGTSGVPAKIDDVSSLIQSIRLPREVLTGRTGLCIELSILYASIMMDAGMDPVIYLIPGHAYPGFKMNGKYYAIESTGIGGEGIGGRMTPDQALQAGMKNLNQFIQSASAGDDRYMLVDVRESINKGAVAMELKDDSYLRQKIDEIAQSFDGGNANINVRQQNAVAENAGGNNANTGNDNGNNDNTGNNNTNAGNNTGAPSGYNLYEGAVTFAYPASWRLTPPAGRIPFLTHLITNSNRSAYVEVYQFNGYNNPEQCLNVIRQSLARYGATLQYRSAGQTNSGYAIYSGQTIYNGGYINWMGAFKSTGNGIAGIIPGAMGNTGTKYQSTLITILNSLK